jgi:hypothetical protein
MIPAGLYLHWHIGRGPLTAEAHRFETVHTRRGTIHVVNREAGDFRFVDGIANELDPSGTRPVFAFGYTGGWSYFLDRPNPTPSPHGFRLTLMDADSMLERARAAQPIAIDAVVYTRIRIADRVAGLRHWEPPMIDTHYMRFDRPYFEKLVAGCREKGRHSANGLTFFVMHDCRVPSMLGD